MYHHSYIKINDNCTTQYKNKNSYESRWPPEVIIL